MRIGLLGLQRAGKTTIFNALTGSDAAVADYSQKTEANVAVVAVADERVGKLTAMYHPKKTVYATIDVTDFPPVEQGASKTGLFPGELMKEIKTVNALAIVLRAFASEMDGAATPLEDLRKIEEEFILTDLVVAETRLERIALAYRKGQKTPQLVVEEKALQKIAERLNAMQPIRGAEFTPDEEKAMRGFQLLTARPMVAIVNTDEDGYGKNAALLADIGQRCMAIEAAGKFEMELGKLSDEEAAAFMQDMGIAESARSKLTTALYETLGYISFFTVGEDEVRAWNIRRGETALDAAGTIHTDLARGFIRAECFGYDDLMELGSEKAIKEKGRLRLEGKEYVVKDGDVLNIRFNV